MGLPSSRGSTCLHELRLWIIGQAEHSTSHTPPPQLRRNAEIQDRETAQVVRRLANQDHPAATLGERQGNQGDPRRASRHIGSSEAYPRDPAPPSIGEVFPSDRHLSLQRSSSASAQVYQEERNPPHRRVHKVSKKTQDTESGYPLR